MEKLTSVMVVLAGSRCSRVKEGELHGAKRLSDYSHKIQNTISDKTSHTVCVFDLFDRTSASRCGAIAQGTGARPSSCLLQKAPAVALTW